jgi:hypothetical protein
VLGKCMSNERYVFNFLTDCKYGDKVLNSVKKLIKNFVLCKL